MIELRPDEFGVVRPLFDGIERNVALVHSVIEGNSPGRVFVDRRESPSSAYLIHEGAFHYVAGDPSNGEFNDAMIAYLFDEVLSGPEAQELVLFAFSEAWRSELDALLSPRGAKRISCKTFAFYPAHFHAHAGWRESLPDGVCVQCIDERLANRNPATTRRSSIRGRRQDRPHALQIPEPSDHGPQAICEVACHSTERRNNCHERECPGRANGAMMLQIKD